MKTLFSILKYLHELAQKGEQELIADAIYSERGIEIKDEHALNLVLKVNESFYRKKKAIHDLHEVDEEIIESIYHLKKDGEFEGTKSLKELIKKALAPYENRTIELASGDINQEEIVESLDNHKVRSSAVNYKKWFFCPRDKEGWKKHEMRSHQRIVFYAFPRARGAKALEEIADKIGRHVETDEISKPLIIERKRYRSFASRLYTTTDPHGLHARPAAVLVTSLSKYPGDIWLRTDDMEIDVKRGIMGVLMLGAEANTRFTISYRPKEKAKDFYNFLQSVRLDNGKPLFTRAG